MKLVACHRLFTTYSKLNSTKKGKLIDLPFCPYLLIDIFNNQQIVFNDGIDFARNDKPEDSTHAPGQA
jgi:hypothetical protein